MMTLVYLDSPKYNQSEQITIPKNKNNSNNNDNDNDLLSAYRVKTALIGIQ